MKVFLDNVRLEKVNFFMTTASINFLLSIFDTNHTEDFWALCKRKDRASILLTLWDDC
jgi:hypothetical protein